MNYKTRKYPLFSACGLNCGLCPRHYTAGKSKCPGCAGEGFSEVHPPCGVLSCCQRKDLEHCYLCGEFPCEKYDNADTADSFITHKNQFSDMNKAKQNGIEAYKEELAEKMKILEHLLSDYDDGRRKGFFCIAVNLLDVVDVKNIMERIKLETNINAPKKEKARIAIRLLEKLADERGIILKLRKK
jgi:hypothetical protein